MQGGEKREKRVVPASSSEEGLLRAGTAQIPTAHKGQSHIITLSNVPPGEKQKNCGFILFPSKKLTVICHFVIR